jgi:hypothetical protein
VSGNEACPATCGTCDDGAASCEDGIQNGDEEGVDCGGPCKACPELGCEEGFYGPECKPCECVNGACHDGIDGTGQCVCDDAWTGDICDMCADNYFPVGESCGACPGSVMNPVKNGSGESGDMSGWNLTKNGGDGWIWASGGVDAIDGAFRTSFASCVRNQLVDLIAAGYTEQELDAGYPITVGEYYHSVYTAGDPYTFYTELRGANQEVLKVHSSGNLKAEGNWLWEGATFTDYGPGVRYVYIADSGQDVEYWSGHYGTTMDATQVRIATGAANACNDNGMCVAGSHGDGECICDDGWAGPACGKLGQ